MTLDGSVDYQLRLNLNLLHYGLDAHANPIPIYQPLPHLFNIVVVTLHEKVFHGRGRVWCPEWQNSICWDGHELKRRDLNEESGPLP